MSSSLTRQLVNKFFPVPRFLEMPAVGIDISDEMIHFIELKRKGMGFEVGRFGQHPIQPDVIELGHIKDPVTFTSILTELRKKYGFYFVKISLPEDKAYLFRTQVPAMPESEIKKALQFKIEENVPISLQKATYDFSIIGKESNEDSLHIDVGVTVIHTKVVEKYLEVFHNAGLVPVHLRSEAQAAGHILVEANDNNTYILIILRETKTVLAIISRHVVQFTSTIPVGGHDITASLTSQEEPVQQDKVIHDGDHMFKSLVHAGEVLRDEIQKMFIYWERTITTTSGTQIKKIIMSGSDSLLGVDRYLAQTFSVPVEIANAWKKIAIEKDEVPPLTLHESLDFIPALGLALPHD
jgi:type IV pilus assembly protein PilM